MNIECNHIQLTKKHQNDAGKFSESLCVRMRSVHPSGPCLRGAKNQTMLSTSQSFVCRVKVQNASKKTMDSVDCVLLRSVTLGYVTFVDICYVKLRYVTLCYVRLYDILFRYVMLCYVMLYCVVLCYAVLCCVTF